MTYLYSHKEKQILLLSVYTNMIQPVEKQNEMKWRHKISTHADGNKYGDDILYYCDMFLPCSAMFSDHRYTSLKLGFHERKIYT